jgi:hypothetical protein
MGIFAALSFAFGGMTMFWDTTWFPTAFLLLFPGASAFAGVAFFALAMQVSRRRQSVTYSI